MTREQVYLRALADYEKTRDNYSVETMTELNTFAGFCCYFKHLLDGGVSDDMYFNMRRRLPELDLLVLDAEQEFISKQIPDAVRGVEWVEMRIELLKQALELMEVGV